MLYIHLPFCHSKCIYCAFYSTADSSHIHQYVDAICAELVMRRHEQNHPLTTIYFGGGTPSRLPIHELRRICDTINANYDLRLLQECTIECNPDDMTDEYIQGLKDLHFFNRVSMGIQTFDDDSLRLLHRRHNSSQALEVVTHTSQAGFDNISLDFIYGLPHQDEAMWGKNLQMLSLLTEQVPSVRHLSCYALTIEPHTALDSMIKQGTLPAPDEEIQLRQYKMLLQWIKEKGFEQYEISSFCRKGYHSHHNSRYWNRTPYTGIGAAAHSFDGIQRRWNISNVRQYINKIEQGEVFYSTETLSDNDAYNEYIMTALRTTEGIDKERIAPDKMPQLQKGMKRYISAGLIKEDTTHYIPTEEGLLHADGIASDLFA